MALFHDIGRTVLVLVRDRLYSCSRGGGSTVSKNLPDVLLNRHGEIQCRVSGGLAFRVFIASYQFVSVSKLSVCLLQFGYHSIGTDVL
jgi:hypothetical protein